MRRLTTFSDGCGMLYPTKLTWGLRTALRKSDGASPLLTYTQIKQEGCALRCCQSALQKELSTCSKLVLAVQQVSQGVGEGMILVLQSKGDACVRPCCDCHAHEPVYMQRSPKVSERDHATWQSYDWQKYKWLSFSKSALAD